MVVFGRHVMPGDSDKAKRTTKQHAMPDDKNEADHTTKHGVAVNKRTTFVVVHLVFC